MQLDDSKAMTNENMLTRFLHNVKLKLFFSATYIVDWISKFKWEKTPTSFNNIQTAYNTLNDLQVYYGQVAKDAKTLKRSQGLFGGFFSGFWTKVFNKMAGNTTKLDTIAKFNAEMGRTVPRLFNQLTSFFKLVNKETTRLGLSQNFVGNQGIQAATTEATGDEDDAELANQFSSALQNWTSELGENPKYKGNEAVTALTDDIAKMVSDRAFVTKDNQGNETPDKDLQDLYNKITQINADEQQEQAFLSKYQSCGGDYKRFKKVVMDFTDDGTGEAKTGIQQFYSVMSQVKDASKQEIKWENGGLNKLSNLYIAENSLYKIIVFLASWVDNVNRGIMFDENGKKEKIPTKDIMTFLKTPTGRAFTAFSQTLNDIYTKFGQQSAFGTLQESTLNELSFELKQLTERREAMKKKNLKRTNEALDKLKKSMDIGYQEPIGPKADNEIKPTNPVKRSLEIDFDDAQPFDALNNLNRLKSLAFDGDVPPEPEKPTEVATPVPEANMQDEIIVTEAPGDPNDPNAQQQDPNAPPAPAPGAAMDTSDAGQPPVDPNDPTAGGTQDPDAAGGATPAPGAGAAPGADPNAAAQPPADPNQQNVAGEAPNADQSDAASGDKFDIGADKPYNDSSDELNLTDQEQEQLFTKINLLTKVPDLVNYGKYFYNITPENVDLDDIHYINALYELSVKLGLLTDDFEGNNLLEKYDSYKYSVLSKNPEKDLQDQAEQVSETTKKVKTENAGEVTIVTAPGVVIAKDVDDYMKQKDEANAEMHGEASFKDAVVRARGLGSLVTFTGMLFGYPAIKTIFIKGPKDEKVAKDEAEKILRKQGYSDVEILAIEPIDPIDYLYREYAGMRTLEDEFTQEFMKQRLQKKVANAVGKVTESVEVGNGIPKELDADVGDIVDNLNKEIMQDPTIDFSKDVGLPKMMLAKEDFEACVCKSPVTEDDDNCKCRCDFKVKKTDKGNLAKVLFSSNCQRVCKCLEGIASTYGITLEAIAEGENILEGADTITLTFKK